MLFSSLDPNVNAQKFVATLSNELQMPPQSMSVRTFVQPDANPAPGLAGAFSHMLTWTARGEAPYVHAIVVQMQQPGPWAATTQVVRTAGSFIVGARLSFAASLRGTVAQATLRRSGGIFAGDPRVATALNTDTYLLQRIAGLTRERLKSGKSVLSLAGHASVQPVAQGGVMFVLATMPEVGMLGGATLHAREFVEVAGRVQQHLDALARTG